MKNKHQPKWLWVLGIACIFAFMGASGDSCSSSGGGSSSSETTSSTGSSSASSDCNFKATDDCTPHVASNRRVRVDALIWQVTSVESAKTLGDQQYGLGAKASGLFVIVGLKVRSDRSESATLTDNVLQLETAKGRKYDPDNDGTVAAIGSGEDPLFLKDIGPDSTVTSKVVFDVPPNVLRHKVEVRFNELGFGSTHGYIRLRAPTPR